jgi:hypothetical protein
MTEQRSPVSASDAWLKLLIALLTFPVAYFVIGKIGATFWRWFILPIVAGAPPLTAGEFAGVWLFLRWFTGGGPIPKKPEQTVAQYASELAMHSFFWPLFALLIGWSIKAVWL